MTPSLNHLDPARAIQLADECERTSSNDNAPVRLNALIALMRCVSAFDQDWAHRLADEVEGHLNASTGPTAVTSWSDMVGALTRTREWDRAERLALGAGSVIDRDQRLQALVTALAEAGEWSHAERLFQKQQIWKQGTRGSLIRVAAANADWQRVDELLRSIDGPSDIAEAAKALPALGPRGRQSPRS